MDVRIVCATNKDLYQLCEDGKFRQDLYYRLNVIPLVVPPLRERTEDIPILASHFLTEARKSNPNSSLNGFTSEAMAKLIGYGWPGNVRELKHLIERLVATVDDTLVRVDHLPPTVRGTIPPPIDCEVEDLAGLKEAKRRLKEAVFAQVEKNFVMRALEKAGWNVTRAAQNVGMARPNFHALMRRYGIRARETDEQ